MGLAAGVAVASAPAADYLGPSALVASRDGKTLYVACADARRLLWVDVAGGVVTRRVELPGEGTGVALTPDGGTLLVTCASPKSVVSVLEASSGSVTATIPVGHTAMGPTLSPDGKVLYVCNRFDNTVSVIDLSTAGERERIRVVREPVAAAVTPDGGTLLVANHLPNEAMESPFMGDIAAVVSLIDTKTRKLEAVRLPSGSHSLRGLCVSPDGKHAYVTHIVSNFELIPTQVDQGWANINAVSVLDLEKKKVLSTVGLDEMYLGFGNPWGIACIDAGGRICVSHAGTHELTVVESRHLQDTLLYIFISALAAAVPDDPETGESRLQRFSLRGKGPRGLTVVGSRVYVAEYFSDSLAVVDLEAEGTDRVGAIPLGPEPKPDEIRRGEQLFNDAAICYQHWQSCASCHPDGRTDALNWDLMNDGVGNFKNTKSLVYAHRTPPVMAEGVRETIHEAVRAGLEQILFTYRPDEEADAIEAYLASLEPVPSPHLVDRGLSPAAERGKELFESSRIGCVKCHPSPLYTDLRKHDVGTRTPYEYKDAFDTPTLIEVWRTAPYLHDGRYATIRDLIRKGKHGKSLGRVEDLTEEELEDLVEFTLSL